jgi:hypothetical protein
MIEPLRSVCETFANDRFAKLRQNAQIFLDSRANDSTFAQKIGAPQKSAQNSQKTYWASDA